MSYTLRFILKTSLIVMVVGFVTGYTLFQSQNILIGPVITVENPLNGVGTQTEVAEIKGSAQNIAFITFNGRQIYTDTEGDFSEKILLSRGYNVVTISAKDKFGRTVDKTLELVLKESKNGYALSVNDESYGKKN